MVPARGAWLLLAATVPVTLLAYAFFPDAEGIVGLSPTALAVRISYEIVTTAVGFVALYRTVRQLRLVHRIHAMALHIDLYQPAPLYAFSSLTAQAGMGFFLLLVPLALLVPSGSGPAAYAVAATWFVTLAVISIAAFVLPLQGMHARIVTRKAGPRGRGRAAPDGHHRSHPPRGRRGRSRRGRRPQQEPGQPDRRA